jgi:hypothetical protein
LKGHGFIRAAKLKNRDRLQPPRDVFLEIISISPSFRTLFTLYITIAKPMGVSPPAKNLNKSGPCNKGTASAGPNKANKMSWL